MLFNCKAYVLPDRQGVEERRALKKHAELLTHLVQALLIEIVQNLSVNDHRPIGNKSPMMCLMSTLLPLPLPPITVMLSPSPP
jgi:hypothetical protein